MQAMQIKMVEVFPMNATLQIPVYQRNYDWRQEQCEKLFSDIETIADKGGTHFLGAIVYKDKKISGMFNELIIVDGQQRITSLILLARALYDSTEDKDIRYAIQANFFRHPIPNPKYPFKLQPTKYDVDVFKKLIGGEELNAHEKSFRLYESYKIFKEKISKSKFSVEQIHNALYSLEFVRMILDNENPQQIFESLNSTGKSLTETELIRNYLLMNLDGDTQEFLYNEYWLPMERMLNDSKTVEEFMVKYLVTKRKSSKYTTRDGRNIQISKNALYEMFKYYFKENYGEDDKAQQVENFLEDLLRYAKFYRRLLFTGADNFEKLSALDKKFYELIYLLDATNSQIILMDLNERYTRGEFDEKIFIQIVDALISLNCRAKVCRRTGIDTVQSAGNTINRFDKFPSLNADSIWQVATQGKGKYAVPSDEEFKQALTSLEIYSSLRNFCKYLLYSFERNLNHSNNFEGYDDLSVEPFIPKKLTAAWEKYLREKNDSSAGMFANALGNLALVTTKNKPSATFEYKRTSYKNSKFSYTKDLARSYDWTSRHIPPRSETLAKLALKIWALPEKYNKVIESQPTFYTFESEFGQFTYKVLDTVSILGKEYKIPYWIDMVRTIAKIFYDTDKDTFKQAVQQDTRLSKFFSTAPENLTSPVQIDTDYYIGGGIDTKNCLKFASNIVENFDRLKGTNYRDDIWFTIKNN